MGRADSSSRIIGDLQVTIFDFAKAGDIFPVHVHALAQNNHITVMARGSIVCHGHPDIEGKIVKAGDVVDWPLNKEHGFEALEDSTRMVNIPKMRI